MSSPRDHEIIMTMADMAKVLCSKGYTCTQERYRAWELGHNIPGRACEILYEMGCNLNWLFTGKTYMMNLKKVK